MDHYGTFQILFIHQGQDNLLWRNRIRRGSLFSEIPSTVLRINFVRRGQLYNGLVRSRTVGLRNKDLARKGSRYFPISIALFWRFAATASSGMVLCTAGSSLGSLDTNVKSGVTHTERLCEGFQSPFWKDKMQNDVHNSSELSSAVFQAWQAI